MLDPLLRPPGQSGSQASLGKRSIRSLFSSTASTATPTVTERKLSQVLSKAAWQHKMRDDSQHSQVFGTSPQDDGAGGLSRSASAMNPFGSGSGVLADMAAVGPVLAEEKGPPPGAGAMSSLEGPSMPPPTPPIVVTADPSPVVVPVQQRDAAAEVAGGFGPLLLPPGSRSTVPLGRNVALGAVAGPRTPLLSPRADHEAQCCRCVML